MADFQINGTQTLRRYMRTQGIDHNIIPRLAGAVNVPVIHFSGTDGQAQQTFTRRITQAQAEALAGLLGTSVANLKTQIILTELP